MVEASRQPEQRARIVATMTDMKSPVSSLMLRLQNLLSFSWRILAGNVKLVITNAQGVHAGRQQILSSYAAAPSRGMDVLSDEVLVIVLGYLSRPVDFARCACVSHRWQTLCRAVQPCHLVFHLHHGRPELSQRQLLWACDKMREGGLANVTRLTFTGRVLDDDVPQQRGIGGMFALMRCLPLHSCTFDSNVICVEIYQSLPDTIRKVTDEATGSALDNFTPKPLAQPCFSYINTFEVSCLHVDKNHPWLSSPPKCLQHLVVRDFLLCEDATELRLDELLPALVSIKLGVYDDATERTVQHILQLPKLIKAHVHFAPDALLLAETSWKLVLSVPGSVTLLVDQPLRLERTSGIKVACSFDIDVIE